MKVHEYQAKEILARYGVPVQRGVFATTTEEAVAAATQLNTETGTDLFVVKAQIHAGGRGKGGGVKLARSIDEVREKADAILGMMLKTPQTGPAGQKVRSVLIADAVDIDKEFYLGITLDRGNNQPVIMASTEGGVEIETVAEETPDLILKEWVDPVIGLQGFQARRLAFGLGFEGDSFKKAVKFIMALYRAYDETDCSIAEINPLTLTTDGDVLAIDAKLNIDDNALFRHKDIAELRDVHEEDPLEVQASEHHLNYVKLDGNVGCMVNGAGLAMATMDIIKLAGGEPANFLDVGGSANPTTVEAGFRIIMKDPEVKAILVNIFGGIVRCDRVAKGVAEAARKVDMSIPLIVRLQGTNAEEGKQILDESGLALETATLFQEAADKVTTALGG
ncbi:MAG: ADP-forming succinate--CoA ligase subunit beta [Bacteroidetes Order II. Incertae sedis bacterium]|jgi:succinyl-CoA synthetase beta subunit|nr:ADP-forming succinate--CoA ligase subunit beta [Bacteroidetes Order II. bacterium]MBT4603028.1 ADP-forming succinate--CoA ligase subunit beta [Bacteroidetes Order II. bacterium]MBT5249648.1 ADP-forming succinate--CoA ligase subunit beta [Bacteroidetes Order II. bacterium]MBT6200268.1 ADP-forming succinate--CoA ligase subunit beta [Bacteroidetes Order II. bacterium]MBT6424303.1 ADP-forming succinate--CoA ligase subunit beta [Bacteroidetes Order II. bacterium]